MFSLTLSVTLAAPSGKSSSSLEVLAGESLTLYCPLFVTNNSVILWSKDTRIMFAGALRVRMDDRYQVVNDNLLISSVTPEDAGEHSCQVEDEGREESDEARCALRSEGRERPRGMKEA